METALVKFLGLLEKGFVVLALLLFTGVRGRPLFYLIYPVILLLSLVHWKGIVRIGIKEKPLWVLLGLILVSVSWSAAPEATLIRSLSLMVTTIFGAYFAARYSLNEQLKLLAWALGLGVLFSFVFTLAFPQYGINHGLHEGAWQGIYLHKNHLGRHMAISVLVFLLLVMSSRRRHRWLLWAGFGLSVSLLLLSASKTAVVIFLIPMILLPLYSALRWSYGWMVPFLIAVVLVGGSVATLLAYSAETILNAMGRDITLTGRTDLWAALFDKAWQRPWFGYGYGGFWLNWQGESADIWLATGWYPPHAHNGLLEIWLALGLVGLLVFIVVFLMAVLRALVWVRSTKSATGFWPLVFLTLIFLVNLTESTFDSRTLFWVLYVATILSTHNNPVSKTERPSI